eukprot:scaffold68721_cov17-Tisochrysis_lutea.AAC.1
MYIEPSLRCQMTALCKSIPPYYLGCGLASVALSPPLLHGPLYPMIDRNVLKAWRNGPPCVVRKKVFGRFEFLALFPLLISTIVTMLPAFKDSRNVCERGTTYCPPTGMLLLDGNCSTTKVGAIEADDRRGCSLECDMLTPKKPTADRSRM